MLIFSLAPDWTSLIHRYMVRPRPMHIRQKQPRLKLGPEEYTVVRKRVLARDGWRCQDCGTMRDLQVHHLKPRSQLGGDVMHNLITLCAGCHKKRHGRGGQK